MEVNITIMVHDVANLLCKNSLEDRKGRVKNEICIRKMNYFELQTGRIVSRIVLQGRIQEGQLPPPPNPDVFDLKLCFPDFVCSVNTCFQVYD